MPEKEAEQEAESFEDSMSRLEELVSGLERGDLSLDHSLKKYEEGIKLLRKCESFLKTAEQRVRVLLHDDYGNVEQQPFNPASAAESSEANSRLPERHEPADDSPPDNEDDDDDIPF
ncbi:MAG: exodeoxyribonuclease VII small subunit [Planctomycetota bacterium]|nr:exodeoxyribonuclease VII small subunit [Planctomycetota bacterium]MDA1139729.1 exodeoxyribonuclease VII small subunit [Planctomycetota bacterium]